METACRTIEVEDYVEAQGLWDVTKLGRIIYGAMGREGYDRMSDLVLDVERKTGVRRHENTLYDIKNGKRLPDLELLTALMLTLEIRCEELLPAILDERHREAYRRLL